MINKLIEPVALHASYGVRLWRVQIPMHEADLGDALTVLSADEVARAARFHLSEDRARFIITRRALRELLAADVGTRPEVIVLEQNRFGKPQLSDEHPLQFSVSHSGGGALIALSYGARVGVDIEQWRSVIHIEAAARQIASAEEWCLLQAAPYQERITLFYRLWTLKEALLKAQGMGFLCDPREINVGPQLCDGAIPMELGITHDHSRFMLGMLDAPHLYSAALAVEQAPQ